MGKNKLFRFSEIQRMPHVIEQTEIELGNVPNPKGGWNEKIFKRDAPIQLELACGKGEYSLFFSKYEPNRNYIGIDIKGNRIYIGARSVEEKAIANVAFFRSYINHIEQFFAKAEVADIWIVFPDPFLGKTKAKKRFTSPIYLKRFQQILQKNGAIHLKTDSDILWLYTLAVVKELKLRVLEQVDDVYKDAADNAVLTNKTFYEQSHLQKARTIRYIKFCLPEEPVDASKLVVIAEENYTH
jgi:tRNA (guanine-N7-)-methyltransferase